MSAPVPIPSLKQVYSKFIDGSRNGQLVSCNDDLRCRWQRLRVTTCDKSFKSCYDQPEEIRGMARIFCPNATATLFAICSYKNVKPYQIGELLKFRADPNSRLDSTADTPLHRLIQIGGKILFYPSLPF